MARILVKGYAGTEHFDGTPCLWLDLTPELAQQWLARIAQVKGLKESDSRIHSLDFWCCHGDFFDLYSLDEQVEGVEALVDALEGEETVELDDVSPAVLAEVERALEKEQYSGGARIRTEVDMLEVADNYVVRSGCVKHTSIRLESVGLRVDDLAKFAGGLEVKPVE